MDATGHRLVALLAAFDFDIKYRPGRNNANADATSSLPTIKNVSVQAQQQDSDIGTMVDHLKNNSKPSSKQTESNLFRKQFSHLRLIDELLYRSTTAEDVTMNQLVLPTVHVPIVLETLVDNYGHHRKDRTTSLVRGMFYWPGTRIL